MDVLNYVKSVKRGESLILRAIWNQFRFQWLAQYFPPKPRVIQLPVNDICNSRCIMCNIWQRKRSKEITPEELFKILADPLFKEIRYVGISGGEPTLRSDLPEIGQTLVESLPKLNAIGIITNALRPDMVIERILGLAEVSEAANLGFDVNVSLDGIGNDHDQNRGTKGNFTAAVRVINQLKQNGLPVSIGCTLTPLNCHGADDVLLWCDQNDISWEFRLGVEIRRIYNDGYSQRYPFTQEQRFHLIMFFDKLARHPRTDYLHRIFYRSLVGQLSFDLPRKSGCSWRSHGVTLDAHGDISYCSAQSPILGSAIEESAWKIFKRGLNERLRIISEQCDGCLHDLLGPPQPKDQAKEGIELIVKPFKQRGRNLQKRLMTSLRAFQTSGSILPADRNSPSEWQHVLVTGWYGTETAGDKAILGELLHFLKIYAPNCGVSLTTLDHKVSRQTKFELTDLERVSLIDMEEAHKPAVIASVDAVIIGGGPLEEIKQIEHIWRMFIEANRQRKARVIFGCGIGPLYSERFLQMVGDICKMTTTGFLRDAESLNYAFKLGAEAPLEAACDPSLAFLQRWLKAIPTIPCNKDSSLIATLVRANTHEYIEDTASNELEDFNVHTGRQIARILERVHKTRQTKAHLLPMHAIWCGGDDRIFNRKVAHFYGNSNGVHVERSYLSLRALLQSLVIADAAVAMRYHGHLFCMALGIPFLSIDYTGGRGKVRSLIERIGYEQWCENWRDIDETRAACRLERLLEERAHWSEHLQQEAKKLVMELHETYDRVFLTREGAQ
jgi:MoaA/NifB/PqqE/SkfB family radical SAM enzyme/polysaccharide pyruvyl transferase WcaK-like protein